MANTNPARGMRDFLPAQVRQREYVISIIKEVYESYGFEPLETPAVENLETLTGKYGEEGNQLIYKILKRGEKLDPNAPEKDLSDLALRYDLTVPLARVVANHKNDLPKFFKRYQIQPVWRADRPARGRYREFYQCDVDAIGSSSMIVEAELISAVCEILHKLGFKDFEIRLNHRKVLTGYLNEKGVSFEKHIDVLVVIDKLNKIGKNGVRQELINQGIPEETIDGIEELFNSFEASGRSIEQWNNTFYLVAGNFFQSEEMTEGLDDFRSIGKYTTNSFAEGKVRFDISLARGLSYYTGAIMEIILTDGDFLGSIGGGGRYDGLIGMFGKEQIPACGFTLGLERILIVMEERGMFPKELNTNSADVLVTIWNEETIGESLKLANDLRQKGLRVFVYPESDKLGKQFKYAAQINVPFVCVLGESELAENKVTLKNMETGEQETIERDEAAARVKIHKQNSQSKS
ncbi:MAG: histidine--tRNA ligase [Pyrinomonadaceae bacterium]